jgi:hypothetical protein
MCPSLTSLLFVLCMCVCHVCRDDAVIELATVCADLDAMQATLADSAVYVR